MNSSGSPPTWLQDLLADSSSGTQLRLTDAGAWREDKLIAPFLDGILRFVREASDVESFGKEWNWFATTQLDSSQEGHTESHDTFFQKTGWRPSDLRGKVVLDAGCGMGRFASVALSHGARVVAVDLSSAVEAARTNLAGHSDIAVVQADLLDLPFRQHSFDLVYSIGVLHHTPAPELAFMRLANLLKPNGELAIWVYSGELRGRLYSVFSDLYRRRTSKMPHHRLLRLCRAIAPLGRFYQTRLGRLVSPLLPVSTHPDLDWRVLDTFDWYAPKYQSKHRWMEVERWFSDAGLRNVRRHSPPVAVSGERP